MLCCEIRLWHKGFGKGTFDPHVFEDEVKFSSFESGDSRWSALLMPQKDLNDKGSQGTSDIFRYVVRWRGWASSIILNGLPTTRTIPSRRFTEALMWGADERWGWKAGDLGTWLQQSYLRISVSHWMFLMCVLNLLPWLWCVFVFAPGGCSRFHMTRACNQGLWLVTSPDVSSQWCWIEKSIQLGLLTSISIVSVRPDFGMNSSCPAWTWFGVHTHTHAPREPFWLWASNVLEPASANGLHRDIVRRVSPNIFQHQCRCHQGECIPNVMFDHSLYVHLC